MDLFKEVLARSHGTPPVLEKCDVTMRLADGTPSNNVKGCVQLPICLADNPEKSFILPVFVLTGPNHLLGRPALKLLFPGLYKCLSDVAQKSVKALSHQSVEVLNSSVVSATS